ncbi:DUF4287 domain-containing protein [Streptomyces rubiginosohelvolus]|uniref:DUF4287 domain-containing protein n=1 Tax=Streptomyces rubiginosohelvolus TaxID=67362 RepID=UPI0036DDF881
MDLVRSSPPARHTELVSWLKSEHCLGPGHADALVAYGRAERPRTPGAGRHARWARTHAGPGCSDAGTGVGTPPPRCIGRLLGTSSPIVAGQECSPPIFTPVEARG